MADDPKGKMTGTVEVDETYVGGKPPKDQRKLAEWNKRHKRKRGRGTAKTPVVALVQRGGTVRARPVANVKAGELREAIREHIDKNAHVITDGFRTYKSVGEEFRHSVIRHDLGDYSRGEVHTNTVESFFALIKRGVYGTFHNISKEHMHRYISEFCFRWNTRKMDDGQRLQAAIRAAEGKRLMYRA